MIPLRDENPTSRPAIVTLLIIIACLAAYFGPQQGLSDDEQAANFTFENAAIPCEIVTGEPLSETEIVETIRGGGECIDDNGTNSFFSSKNVYLAILYSMFLHGGLLHIASNMWILWIFGNNIEDRLGPIRYILLYLVGGVVATFAHLALNVDSTIPLVGASGAIAAVMGAYLVWFPNAPILTVVFFMLRDITAKWFLGFWFISQFFIGNDSGVAWAAHVGGFVFGAIVALALRESQFGQDKINRSTEPLEWDYTGGAGYGTHPHLFEKQRGLSDEFKGFG